MPLALFRRGYMEAPVHGEEPGWRYISSDSEAFGHEVVFPESYLVGKEGWVWDEGLGELRKQTDEELAAEAFTLAKNDKLVEFFIDALKDVLVIVPEAEGTYDRVPTDLLLKALIAHFLAQAEREAGDPTKWQQMLQTLGKLRVMRGYVGKMTPENSTIEDIRAAGWSK